MIDDFKPARRRALPVRHAPKLQPDTKTNSDTTFRTPEEAATIDPPRRGHYTPAVPSAAMPKMVLKTSKFAWLKHGWRERLALHWPPGRKEFGAVGLLLVLIASGASVWALTHPTHAPVAAAPVVKKVAKPAPKPTTVASTLSGLQVDPAVNARPVTGVMIENSTFARPQAGLSQASVVFEAIAEGGITRFLALFQDNQPENVGPIRSVRPYYLQWALGFDASVAHVGGSPEALADIKAWGVKDLDQFFNSGAYHRVGTREAPHNVYSGLSALNQLESSKGTTGSNFTGFLRKAEAPSKQPTAKSVTINISGPSYNVHYDYDAATNSYKRVLAGAAHIDFNTNSQISPKVVVAMVMPYSVEADGYHSNYGTIGTGTVYVFQDGNVTTGQWSKLTQNEQFTFTDSNGQPLGLNPGQTWMTAVKADNNVISSP